MQPERWGEIKEILNACLTLPPEERESSIERFCGGDAELNAEIRSLLQNHEGMGDFLEGSVFEAEDEEVLTGRQLGQYRLCERIAAGGMGTVYRAARSSDFEKQVAVKLVKRGMDTDFILRRFRHERQILAGLDHPNIARLLDGGATPDGRPWFAMELIEGTPITEYADGQGFSTRERLEIFRTVCSAVQYAHQNLVVHRDLKPSNILVTADGAPKLVDFGIARLLEPEAAATAATLRLLTPQCASPEQVLGRPVTTSSDIYSLGVLLYQLLTGEPPYQFETGSSEEMARLICEVEPKRPSSIRPLSKDLDNIVAKAMHKDPGRRYASAAQFSEDIERYLGGRPVSARKDTLFYRTSKFITRHKGATIAAALTTFSLLAGLGATLWEANVSRHERDRADRQAAVAQAVNDFLQNDLLAQASATAQSGLNTKPDPDLKVRTALDRAALNIAGKFNRQPEVEAAVRETMGQTYIDLGLYPQARTQLERSLTLRRRALGPENPTTLRTLSRIGRTAFLQGKYAEAETLLSLTLGLQRRLLGAENADTLYSMNNLAEDYRVQAKYAQAEDLYRQALDIQRRRLGPEHPNTLSSMNNLGLLYISQGKYTEAETLLRQTLEVRRRSLGPEHPNTLSSMNNLGLVYNREDKYREAAALYGQTLEIMRRVLGPDHPSTLVAMTNFAEANRSQGKYAEAEVLDSLTLETRRRLLGLQHPNTLSSMNNLASDYLARRKYGEAEALLQQTLRIKRQMLGPEHPSTLNTLSNFGAMYQREGRYALAETYAVQALAGRQRALGAQHPDTMYSAANLALAYVSEGKFAEGEKVAREVFEFALKKHPNDWERFRAESLCGASLAGEKKYREAEPLLLEAYGGMLARKGKVAVTEWYHLERASEWIEQLYEAWGKAEKEGERRRQ